MSGTVDGGVVIETERLLLRRMTHDDAPAMFALQSNPRVNRFIGGDPPPWEEWLEAFCARWPAYYQQHGFGLWATVRKSDGAVMGRIGLLAQEIDGVTEVEVAYSLDEPYWGAGYATEAAVATRDWAFARLDVPHVVSIIAPDNRGSIGVARKNGLSLWKDTVFRGTPVHIFRITRDEWEEIQTMNPDR